MTHDHTQATLTAFEPRSVAPWDPSAIDPPETPDELLTAAQTHAAAVAEYHDLTADLDALDWEVSKRAQRRSGAVKHHKTTGDMTVSLTWPAFERFGWEEFADTVRHELVHVEQIARYGKGDHGPTFYSLADEVDAGRHCRLFKQPKFWIVCGDCETPAPRYKRSKIVKHTGRYSCGNCGGPLRVEEGDWMTVEEFNERMAAMADDE